MKSMYQGGAIGSRKFDPKALATVGGAIIFFSLFIGMIVVVMAM